MLSLTNYFFRHIKRAAWLLFFVAAFWLFPSVVKAQTEAQKDSVQEYESRGDTIVSILQNYADTRKTWAAKALRAVLLRHRDTATNALSPNQFSFSKYERYTDKIIRKIEVQVLEPFGPSVVTPKREPGSRLERNGNRLHRVTRTFVVRNRLLFHSGDRLKPIRLSESERLLRQSSYIYDARITLRRVRQSPDSIDVVVITQDLWSLTGGGSVSAANNFNAYATDVNFLGLGSRFSAGYNLSPTAWKGQSYTGDYQINNLGNTYITALAYHYGSGQGSTNGISLNRDFFSTLTEWAGGFASTTSDMQAFTSDSLPNPYYTSYKRQDLWAGYAADFDYFNADQSDKDRNYIIGARVIKTQYSNIPYFDTLHQFQDNTTFLGSLGYVKRRYFKDNFILGLGRTEDVPTGSQISVTGGIEEGQFINRPYMGYNAGYADYGGKRGFFYLQFQTGMYRRDNAWRDRVLTGSLLYFTPLLHLRRWRMRHFAIGRYQHLEGYYMPNTYLSISNTDGIRGFSPAAFPAVQKAVLNLETNLYPPLTLAGFRFAAVLFADFGLAATEGHSLLRAHLFRGYGLGLRLRNEYLLFSVIQVQLGFYPDAAAYGANWYSLFARSGSFYKFNQFQPGKPGMAGLDF